MARRPYVLTADEEKIIERSAGDPRWFTDRFLGWVFDFNIDPPWQLDFCLAKQKQLVVIGGVGSSKTVTVGMSAFYWAATTHHFKFMNVAPTLYQSEQMYNYILQQLDGRPAQKFVWKATRKPHPQIVLKHSGIGESLLEFMSVANDADNILSWEGDWVNIDEAGLLDDLDDILVRLATRLRGSVQGRIRLGRLSLTTNPHVNPTLYYLFDMSQDDPENCLSFQPATRDNKNVTEDQIRQMTKFIPDQERERWLKGERPEGAGKEFPTSIVDLCEDAGLDDVMSLAREQELEGFVLETAPRAGIVRWERPPEARRNYIVAMDPGQGVPPHRNAPVVTAWDVTDFPRGPATLMAFWWGFGMGSYQPCISQFLAYMAQYNAFYGLFDSTGTQAGFDEMFNLSEQTLAYGVNLAGQQKYVYLTAHKLLMGKGLLKWPAAIKGIRQQHLNYALPDRKLVQDIVSNFIIVSGFVRRYYVVDQQGDDGEAEAVGGEMDRHDRLAADRHSRPAGERA